jgi:hypothetical protein
MADMIVLNPSVCDSCSTSIDVTPFIDAVGDVWHFCPACRAAPLPTTNPTDTIGLVHHA